MGFMGIVFSAIIPLFIVVVVILGSTRKRGAYDAFVRGAKQGISTAFRVLPYVVAMMAAVAVFRASGALDYVMAAITPVLNVVGVPAEVMPIAIMRPFSGGAALGLLTDLFQTIGPDTYAGVVASVLIGSSETIFYTIALYFGSVGVVKTRYVIGVALFVEVATLIFTSFLVCVIGF